MNSLDLLNKRLNYYGGNADGRLNRDKLMSLMSALDYSYQNVTITHTGEVFKALINPDKTKQDYDDKIISIPFNSLLKAGDVFTWNATQTNWIVYRQQLSEEAYFRGAIRLCRNQIKWLDDFGITQSTYAAVVGPVETKIVSDQKTGIVYDSPNYTLTVFIPDTLETRSKFKRYYKLMFEGLAWEVQTADFISMPGIIQLVLKEHYKNTDEDTEELIDGQIILNTTVSSSLDIGEIMLETPYELWTIISNGEKTFDLDFNYSVVSGNATITNNNLIIHDLLPVKIELMINDISYVKEYNITAVEVIGESTIIYNIIGPLLVKPFGITSFTIKKYVDGIDTVPNGTWTLVGSNGILENSTSTSTNIKWTSTKSGTVTLRYSEDTIITDQVITVQSLF